MSLSLHDATPSFPSASPRPAPVRQVAARPPRRLWWASPIGAVVMVVPLSLFVAVRTSDLDFRIFYRVPKELSSSDAVLFVLAALALVLGLAVPMVVARRRPVAAWPASSGESRRVLARSEPIAFWLTAVGYLLTLALGVARGATPGVLLSAVTSGDNYTGQLKTLFAPVAGITSLTQVGIAYVVIAGTLLCDGRQARLVRRVVIVVVLGLLRAYLLTERLAVLELIVPLVAIGAYRLRQRPRGGAWVNFAPVFALPLLVVVFGAFEYSRSWVFFRDRTTLSFPEFVVNRLAGYYATSYNNGALQLAHGDTTGRLPYDSIQAFWTAPGISQLNLYERLSGQNGGDLLNNVLLQYGTPEFNNPGGLSVPLVDMGVGPGLVFFLLLGLVVGSAYVGWRAGRPVGLLLYPVLFTGALELPRYLYWTQGRTVPAVAVLLVVAYLMNRASRRGRTASPAPTAVDAS